MDPNLFHLDWERAVEVLSAIIILSFFVERSLAIIFEHRFYISRFSEKGLKAPLAFLLSLLICWKWDFDAPSMIILAAETTMIGKVITAAVIAGGSKASIRLFQQAMDVMSDSERARKLAVAARDQNGG